jgi:hypothetical protein
MSAPAHVRAVRDQAAYVSPPRRAEPWTADRPGEVVGSRQPAGPALGNQGPDQGYVWKLIRRFEDRLLLTDGEHVDDVLAGCVGVALRRASLFGRAPVGHDVEVALTVFGFLDEVDSDLARWRRDLFAEVSHPHHYARARLIADLVPEETLRLPADDPSAATAADLKRAVDDR